MKDVEHASLHVNLSACCPVAAVQPHAQGAPTCIQAVILAIPGVLWRLIVVEAHIWLLPVLHEAKVVLFHGVDRDQKQSFHPHGFAPSTKVALSTIHAAPHRCVGRAVK